MGNNLLTQNPFGVLTFIVAPAILTNATSVLAMSTINRFLRTRERMHELYRESETSSQFRGPAFIEQVRRVEQQAIRLLSALRWIYIGLGAFAAASLVTLMGALLGQFGSELLVHIIIAAGLLLGVAGVAGLIGGCTNLFQATQLSLTNIREEADFIRTRQEQQRTSGDKPT